MMTTLTEPITSRPVAPRQAPEDGTQRLLLDNISWQEYIAVGQALPDRPGLRITYDRGRLEFMTTSPRHEIYKKRLSRLLEMLAEECNRNLVSAGNMTFQREDLDRGLEPDDCFWIAHEPHMRAKLTWDPALDPPPDLVLEIEISRSAQNRMSIYAALRVPEVWRYDGETLRVELLQPDGTWQSSENSPTFPGISLEDVLPFLEPPEGTGSLELSKTFRAWVREQLSRQS
jgi:Uma2 family endonuclease